MQKDLVLAVVSEATKGANIKLSWHRACKTKKTCSDAISKEVHAVGRVGINYDNQKAVIEKRENGELPEQSQPIWHGKGEWAIFPYLIRHTVTGQYYLRLYTGTGTAKPSVQFYRNGQAVSFENVAPDLLASEKNSEKGDCFCCKVEDMTGISWIPAPPKIDRDSVKDEVPAETEAVPA